MRLLLTSTGALVVLIGLQGCATVKPWQRGNLSEYAMRLDRDPLSQTISDHIYTSREAASGGRGIGGGGCGCD